MESTNNSSQMHTPAAPSGQMSEAFYQLVQIVLPLLGSEAGRADFLHHLELLSRWVSTMPRSLQVNRPWTREEFAAALAGPENLLDPRFGAYMDEAVYRNSPVHYLAGMPMDHPYIELYNQKRAVICVGQGAWEMPDSTRQLDGILRSKNIQAWVDYWGYDCCHDWPWWYKQVSYFVPHLLE